MGIPGRRQPRLLRYARVQGGSRPAQQDQGSCVARFMGQRRVDLPQCLRSAAGLQQQVGQMQAQRRFLGICRYCPFQAADEFFVDSPHGKKS